MCRALVSCAEFKAILTPFSEVVRNRSLSFRLKEVSERQTASSIAGQTSLHKSLSSQKEKSRIVIKPTAA